MIKTLNLNLWKRGTCAWRAVYINVWGMQFARIVLDPTSDRGPQLSAAIPYGWWRNQQGDVVWRRIIVRINLPSVKWKHPANRLHRWAYRCSNRFWGRMDARLGFGSQ